MRTARFCVFTYFVLTFLGLLWYFALIHLRVDLRVFCKMLVLAGVGFLAVGVLLYRRRLPPIVGGKGLRIKMGVYAAAIVLLTLYGLADTRRTYYNVFIEAAGHGMIFLFLLLGRYDQVWKDLEKPLIVLFWICFAVVVIGLFYPLMITEDTLVFLEASTNPRQRTVGYSIQHCLHFWPLLFAMAYLRPRWDRWKVLGLGTMLAYLALAVYFEKRAPMARALAYAAMVLVVVPVLLKRIRLGTGVLLTVVLAMFFAAASFTSRFGQLVQRYEQRDVTDFWNTPRIQEVRAMFSELTPAEWIVGKGFGGYYTSLPWTTGVSTVTSDGLRGRLNLHIGVFRPILKGGLLFAAIYFWLFVPMIRHKPRGWYSDRFNTAVMAVLPVYLMFQLIASAPSFTTYVDTALVGMALGRLGTPLQPDYAEVPDLESYEAYGPEPSLAGLPYET